MSWDVGAWVINTLKNFLNTNLVTNHGSQVFTSSGTFTVPAGVYSIRVIAAGGGGGGGFSDTVNGAGGAGGGGASCIDRRFAVTPGQQIAITIGASGSGASTNANAGNGGATVVGTLITVPGGKGAHMYSHMYAHTGGLSGGNGGGVGGSSGYYAHNSTEIYTQKLIAIPRGGDGLFGSGGREGNIRDEYGTSGGGGGSFGNGGNGAYCDFSTNKFVAPTVGSYGGGGGGGGYNSSSNKSITGAKGGAGICIIEW